MNPIRIFSSIFDPLSRSLTTDSNIESMLNPFALIFAALIYITLPKKYQSAFLVLFASLFTSLLSKASNALIELPAVSAEAIEHNLAVQTLSATLVTELTSATSIPKTSPYYNLDSLRIACDSKYNASIVNEPNPFHTFQLYTNDPRRPADFVSDIQLFGDGNLRPNWASVHFEYKCMVYKRYQLTKAPSDKRAQWTFYPVVTQVRGLILPVKVNRASTPNYYGQEYEYQKEELNRGHILALELGGPNIPENILPQPKYSNQQGGSWRQNEIKMVDDTKKLMGITNKMDTTSFFPNGPTKPSLPATAFPSLNHFKADITRNIDNSVNTVQVSTCQLNTAMLASTPKGTVSVYDYIMSTVRDYSQCNSKQGYSYDFSSSLQLNAKGELVNAAKHNTPSSVMKTFDPSK